MTMDGRTATCTGRSRWVTGDKARMRIHRDRNRYSTIMTGVGTILKDDPLLTCRLPDGRSPVQVVYGAHPRTPATSRIVSTVRSVRAILVIYRTEEDTARPYEGAGYEVLTLPQVDGHVDLAALMKRLGEMNIGSVLLEGRAALNWSTLDQGPVHKVQIYVAPRLFGGKDAPSSVDGKSVGAPGQAFFLKQPRTTMLGGDILLESEVSACLQT